MAAEQGSKKCAEVGREVRVDEGSVVQTIARLLDSCQLRGQCVVERVPFAGKRILSGRVKVPEKLSCRGYSEARKLVSAEIQRNVAAEVNEVDSMVEQDGASKTKRLKKSRPLSAFKCAGSPKFSA
jgi:hypothetical protein